MTALDRFIKYVKIDTQADDTTGTTPSTAKQKNLGKVLVEELLELGLSDAYMDEWGNVYAHLDGEKGDTIGLNAHMDTALEVTDENCNPRIVKSWDGNDIKLNDIYTLSSKEFPVLKNHVGKDLVVTDGNTLLGADDKAGIAIIMGALDYLQNHKEIKHHPISVCFTVDEEIGEGPLHFSTEKMKADYAFTLDGGDIDTINCKNFNAQQAHITIEGVAVHPGEGKGQLVNALVLMSEFISALPQDKTPYDATMDEGYWHLNTINGSSEKVESFMILREFDKNKLSALRNKLFEIKDNILKKWPRAKVEIEISDQYENMEDYVKNDPRPVNKAVEAIKALGYEPKFQAIRGGTDGATFSKMGLVTPNLGTASANHHGRYEFLVVQDMYKMIDIVVEILKIK